jgi:transcriptional regulator with XRE-family HTH domain
MVAVVNASTDLKKFGQKVREARKEQGLKQRTLAEMLGFGTHTVISEIENGIYSALTLEVVYQLATALDLSVHELVATDRRQEPRQTTARAYLLGLSDEERRRIEAYLAVLVSELDEVKRETPEGEQGKCDHA